MRTEDFGDITVTDDGVSVVVTFLAEPSRDVRAALRGHSFKPSGLAWRRPSDAFAWSMGKLIACRACHGAGEIL